MSLRWTHLVLLLLLLAVAHWSWGWHNRAKALERQRDEQRMSLLAWQLKDAYEVQLAGAGDPTSIDSLQAELTELVPSVDVRQADLSRLMQYGREALKMARSGQREDALELLHTRIEPACERLAVPLASATEVPPSPERLGLEAAVVALGALVLVYFLGRTPRAEEAAPPILSDSYTDRVLRSLSNLLIVIGADGAVRSANAVACDVLGYSEQELVGKPFSSILVGSANPVKMGSCRNLEAVYRGRDGSAISVLMSCSPVLADSGQLSAVVTLAQDITQRKETENQLELKEAYLRKLVARLVSAQDEERRSVARDLHDGMLQYVIAADLQLQLFKKKGGDETLSRAVEYLKGSVEEGRRLIYDLRPSALEQLGLVETLRRQLEGLRQELGWQVEFSNELNGTAVPGALETSLYRIAGECMNNARRHSQTQRVELSLRHVDGEIRMEFRDWGVGFDPSSNPGGVGLGSMRERVELLRGRVEVESAPGQGTVVKVDLPLT